MGIIASKRQYEIFPGENPGEGIEVTGTTSYYSKRLDCDGKSRASFHLIWTGTAAGALTIWSTNDQNAADDADTGWYNESDVTMPAQPAGSASSVMLHIFENAARWARIKYVNASGEGTLRGVAVVKE